MNKDKPIFEHITDEMLANQFVKRMVDDYKNLEQENEKLKNALWCFYDLIEYVKCSPVYDDEDCPAISEVMESEYGELAREIGKEFGVE